jgi:hypothetical protein
MSLERCVQYRSRVVRVRKICIQTKLCHLLVATLNMLPVVFELLVDRRKREERIRRVAKCQ